MFEELLAAGHTGAEYDAWLIRIDGDQFGSGFVAVNPNSKIPALMDRSGPEADPGLRVRRDPAAPGREVRRLPADRPARRAPRRLSWLFWQMGSAPYLGGGFGHFYAYAPTKIEYAIDRFAMEVKRQLDVLDRRLAEAEYLGGDEYTIADMAVWPWYGGIAQGLCTAPASSSRSARRTSTCSAGPTQIGERPAVKRGAHGQPPVGRTPRPRRAPLGGRHRRHPAGEGGGGVTRFSPPLDGAGAGGGVWPRRVAGRACRRRRRKSPSVAIQLPRQPLPLPHRGEGVSGSAMTEWTSGARAGRYGAFVTARRRRWDERA